MIGEDVLYLTVSELGDRIKARKLSAVQLAEAYLGRSEQLGRSLNSYATLTRDLALQQARTADKEIAAGKYRGTLHGIPYAAKDLLAVNGYPTTWGAKPFARQQFDFNATVIEKLNAAGAVLLGKAAMIELAGGMGYRFASASLQGPAKNPWSEACWTCGSSSGSGGIVASAQAAFAIGTETWGSIVCPSAFCGVSGLRPTYGRVSRHGAMALAYSMDKIGPMCRSAQDCATVLSAIAGHDPLDPASLEAPAFSYRRLEHPLRIGWLSHQWKKMWPGVELAVNAARDVLAKQGVHLQDIELPEGPWEQAAGTIVAVEGAAAFHDLIDSGRVSELIDPAGKIGGYVSEQIPASDYIRANRVRRVIQQKMASIFDQVDVLACASLPATATKLDANLDEALDFPDPIGGIGNMCGLPAISIPCGFADDKLPVGIQFVGPVMGEDRVLTAAILFQQHTDWHRKRPPLS